MASVAFFSCREQQQNKTPATSSTTKLALIIKDTIDASQQDSAHSVKENFNSFWKTFRQAVLSSDTTQIKSLTAFPLKYRGTSDSDPLIKMAQDKFVKVFSLFLSQWNGVDLKGFTELDYIRKTDQSAGQGGDRQIRMGDMVFYQTNEKWELAFLFLNNETLDLLKKKK